MPGLLSTPGKYSRCRRQPCDLPLASQSCCEACWNWASGGQKWLSPNGFEVNVSFCLLWRHVWNCMSPSRLSCPTTIECQVHKLSIECPDWLSISPPTENGFEHGAMLEGKEGNHGIPTILKLMVLWSTGHLKKNPIRRQMNGFKWSTYNQDWIWYAWRTQDLSAKWHSAWTSTGGMTTKCQKPGFFQGYLRTLWISRLWAPNPGYCQISFVLHLLGAHGNI